MFTRKFHLVRLCSQNTNPATIDGFVTSIMEKAFGDRRGKGWTLDMDVIDSEQLENGSWVHQRDVTLVKKSPVGDIEGQYKEIIKAAVKEGQHQRYNKYPWVACHGPEDIKAIVEKIDEPEEELPPIEVNTDPGQLFDHIFDRQHQISMALSAIKAGVRTKWEDRHHCLFYGPPGCGKSDLVLTLGQMLGKEDQHYTAFDATSLTEAGMTKVFGDMAQVPPVVLIEELEKAPENSLRWLLGLMDRRAEIRRTNFRIGNVKVKVKSLIIATVNNMTLFRTMLAGALASRFSHEIYCPRPSRTIMARILKREVDRVGGDVAWIEPTLKLCFDKYQITDPRKIIPVCLCGSNGLLDGSYQAAYEGTQEPSDKVEADKPVISQPEATSKLNELLQEAA